MSSLRVENLVKHYNKFTLGPISFHIPKGAVVALIGKNGAGKTTLIKSILNLVHLDEGLINILDADEKDVEIKNKVGAVFHHINLPDKLSLKQVNSLCSTIYKEWDEEVFYSYLEEFSLDDEMKIEELSEGMKVKLSLAIALSHHAELLILDEPAANLDPIIRKEMLDILYDFMDDEKSVLISSHILSDIEKIADYIILLDEGKLIFYENKDELKENYYIFTLEEDEVLQFKGKEIYKLKQEVYTKYLIKTKETYDFLYECPSIEDIMVFYLKGEKLC